MATKQQVRNRVAQDLRILELNQALESQDVTRIESSYDEVYEELKEEGIAIWAFSDEVPTRIVPYFINLVANRCLDTYALSQERSNRIFGKSVESLKEIRRFLAEPFVSVTEPEDF